jgi:hypothetical protein
MKIELIKTGFERYYTVDGKKCPSVTQVVRYHEDMKFLEDWKSRNPLKADKTSSSARMRGTKIHQALFYYHTDIAKFNSAVEKLNPEDSKYLNNYTDLIRITLRAEFLEQKVGYLDPKSSIGFGGKLDNISLLDTKEFVYYKTDKPVFINPEEYFVIDYKNPNKAKKPEHLVSYCLQLAAYCAAFNFGSLLTYRLNKALLVVVSPKMTTYYYLSPEKLGKYWSLYKKLLDGYYTKKKVNWTKLKEELGVFEDERGYPRINKINFLPERIELRKNQSLVIPEEEELLYI